MKHLPLTSLLLALSSAFVLVITSSAVNAAEKDSAWQSLITGSDLAGWKVPNPNPFWKIVDGVLVGESDEKLTGNMLWTEKDYRDVVIEVEARWAGEIDSGIMIRKPDLQMQIGVSRSLKKDMTCSFYTGGKEEYPEAGQAKGIDKLLKPGDWNKIRLEAKGATFVVWINGKEVANYTNAKYPDAGPIGLQIHPGLKMKVEFRNLRVKTLNGD
jgi:hypothetical protein